ncbi:MAG: PEP-CTERM sorting domain-containing protein [Planctomycetes bacterium]|nr:PEP-CTERM sorting domain-containing protein [Planctomycetota bacterium]
MRKLLFTLPFLAVLLPAAAEAGPISLDFANVASAKVRFDAATDTFTFDDATSGADLGRDFVVTGVSSGALGDDVFAPLGALDLRGNIDGTFQIGTISTSGGHEWASVTGSGQLRIHDGLGGTFTADLSWVTIETLGGAGGINAGGALNLTSTSYSGSNPDLVLLASLPGGITTVSFQFVPGKSLTELVTNGGRTSYSGSLVSVPEPTAMGLVGLALAALAARRRRGQAAA